MDFACRSLWGPVDNVTLPDTIYKGVALCGWDEIGLWSICSSEKNKPVERNGTANVERIFLEGECFICTRSAPKADDMKGNWIRYLGNSFPHWLAKLKTKGLLRDGGLTEDDGHSAPGTAAPCRDKNCMSKWQRLLRYTPAGLWLGGVAVNWSQWD